eukprot:1194570-Prorocentrum_minimum.AAC.6
MACSTFSARALCPTSVARDSASASAPARGASHLPESSSCRDEIKRAGYIAVSPGDTRRWLQLTQQTYDLRLLVKCVKQLTLWAHVEPCSLAACFLRGSSISRTNRVTLKAAVGGRSSLKTYALLSGNSPTPSGKGEGAGRIGFVSQLIMSQPGMFSKLIAHLGLGWP